ncbi:MAG: GspH/FimT family pseudopilin [Acidobacteria bacterium]|nr:GspH/FimT family pseudopilin [Acidobacteriota bacterium]
MGFTRLSDRGFSLTELMLTVATAATLMAVTVPILTDVTEGSKLNAAARELERELQSARLKAVSANRILRVRLNCPATGYYRTVELLNTTADAATNRCLLTAYPFPADTDVMTRPNHDGPVRTLPSGATVASSVLEFRPDGTAYNVVTNVAQTIATPVTLTVTRNNKSKSMTINGAGKIQFHRRCPRAEHAGLRGLPRRDRRMGRHRSDPAGDRNVRASLGNSATADEPQ